MKTIVITGTSSGIGEGLLNHYLEKNWRVISLSRKNVHPKKNNLIQLPCDFTKWEQIESCKRELGDQPIDMLINNAGMIGPKVSSNEKYGASEWKEWSTLFETNTIAPFYLIQILLPNILKGELKIIANMSSIMGSFDENKSGGLTPYRSSKSALNMVTQNLAIELKEKGVTVVSLHPGWVKTKMGGSDAEITIDESVKGLTKILHSLTIKNSGEYISYDGERFKW